MRTAKGTAKRYGNYFRDIYNVTGNSGSIEKDRVLNDIGAPKSFWWMSTRTGYIVMVKRGVYKINLDKIREEKIKDFAEVGAKVAKEVTNYNEKMKSNKDSFTPPAKEEVMEYFSENRFPKGLGEQFYNHYNKTNWKQNKGNKIKNWKLVAQNVWFKNNESLRIKDVQLEIQEVFPMHKTSTLTPTEDTPVVEHKKQKRIKLFWGLIDVTI